MGITIGTMIAEIRENNIAKGWRSAAGGPGGNTLGDYISLLHTEIGEATDAYRDWKLDDGTGPRHPLQLNSFGQCAECDRPNHDGPYKPEGVGSELADVLIRLLDTGDVFGFTVFDPDFELADVAELVVDPIRPRLVSFGDHMSWLHRRVDALWTNQYAAPLALRALVTVARGYGIELMWEYDRKMAYNRTRPYRHGGRALVDTGA